VAEPQRLDVLLRRASAGYGLIRSRLPDVAGAMAGPTPGKRSVLRETCRTHDVATALTFLADVTHPATRHVVLQVSDSWVAIINNGRNGSDFADTQRWLSRRTASTTIRVVDRPAAAILERNGYRCRLGYEERIVEVFEGPSLRRAITCMDDGGRWTFEASGEPLPIESTFDYAARRKRDRFTSGNLSALLTSLGAAEVDASTITKAAEFSLVVEEMLNKDWRRRIERDACSVEEAEDPAHGYFLRAQAWIDHLETHASSAVVDLTKAVLLNPAYERRSRRALDRARKQLGGVKFDSLVAEAQESLRRNG
jgi:hypothetical protein